MAKSRRSQDEYLLWNSFAIRHSKRRRFCNATMKDVFGRHVNLGKDPARDRLYAYAGRIFAEFVDVALEVGVGV